MYKLCTYYKDNDIAINTIEQILGKGSNITLRVIDWFVTYYCKYKSNELYNIYNIYVSYKLQLKSYSKKLFDPFCRGDRICLQISRTNVLETTVGQLNFFRWIIDQELLKIYQDNKTAIEQEMLDNGFKLKLEGRGRKKK